MAALGNYLDAASAAVRARDGAALARLLDVTNSDASRAVTSCLAENREVNLGSLCQQKLPQPYDEVFAHHCQCLGAIGEGRFEDAFAAVTATTQAFVKDFKLQETAWSLDALVHVVKAAKELATRADAALVAAGKKAGKLHDAGALLMLVYRNTANTSVTEKKTSLPVSRGFPVQDILQAEHPPSVQKLDRGGEPSHVPGVRNLPVVPKSDLLVLRRPARGFRRRLPPSRETPFLRLRALFEQTPHEQKTHPAVLDPDQTDSRQETDNALVGQVRTARVQNRGGRGEEGERRAAQHRAAETPGHVHHARHVSGVGEVKGRRAPNFVPENTRVLRATKPAKGEPGVPASLCKSPDLVRRRDGHRRSGVRRGEPYLPEVHQRVHLAQVANRGARQERRVSKSGE
mmetsp:Transcript_6572/g.24787  ORF Transcript_6572/g.24787 Transcript_6572/m.24787 type:complete len:402 (-) Transcript_6572:1265-2470(-)